MDAEYLDFNDLRRSMDREREQLTEKIERIDYCSRLLEIAEKTLSDYEKVKDENESLKQLLQEKEMQLNEMTKLSASVAGKASQEALHKALRVFVNKSKRKKIEKRIAIKEMVLELANANSAVLPEDLAAAIDSLDDEQTEPVSVNVNVAAGGINVQHANTVTR